MCDTSVTSLFYVLKKTSEVPREIRKYILYIYVQEHGKIYTQMLTYISFRDTLSLENLLGKKTTDFSECNNYWWEQAIFASDYQMVNILTNHISFSKGNIILAFLCHTDSRIVDRVLKEVEERRLSFGKIIETLEFVFFFHKYEDKFFRALSVILKRPLPSSAMKALLQRALIADDIASAGLILDHWKLRVIKMDYPIDFTDIIDSAEMMALLIQKGLDLTSMGSLIFRYYSDTNIIKLFISLGIHLIEPVSGTIFCNSNLDNIRLLLQNGMKIINIASLLNKRYIESFLVVLEYSSEEIISYERKEIIAELTYKIGDEDIDCDDAIFILKTLISKGISTRYIIDYMIKTPYHKRYRQGEKAFNKFLKRARPILYQET